MGGGVGGVVVVVFVWVRRVLVYTKYGVCVYAILIHFTTGNPNLTTTITNTWREKKLGQCAPIMCVTHPTIITVPGVQP